MILLDIGNTFTRIRQDDGKIRIVPTAELTPAELPAGKIAACCVVPAVRERLADWTE